MEKKIFAYFGHHKAGTTWIIKIIDSICFQLQLNYANFHSPKLFDFDLQKTIEHKNLNFFSYTNADINYIKHLQNIKGFHVIRDPRDIVVSAYFSHLYTHATQGWPELIEQRNRLENLSKDQGLLVTVNFLKNLKVYGIDLNLFDSMYNWDYSMSNVIEVKFEDLIANSTEKFIEIFQFLGIADVDTIKISEALQSNNFSVLSGGRKTGQENLYSHYRKGTPGDWKNHFNQEHIDFFKTHYNELLIKLGYETTANW